MKYLIPALVFLFAGAVTILPSSLETTLSGYVHDAETDAPIENAVVELIELTRFDVTNKDGFFTFGQVASATYTVKISHLGYKPAFVTINTTKSSTKDLIVHLSTLPVQTSAVIVSDFHHESEFTDITEMGSVVKGKQLQRKMGSTVAATLKNEVGLAIRSMGPAPSRPVIRGLSGDRVHINEDTHATKDLSATSPDHAVTVEPFTVERIEVIRGPRVLMYSPTTIGGVVNIQRNEIPSEFPAAITGNAGAYYESVNNGWLTGGVLSVPVRPFVARLEFSNRNAGDVSTPAGTLGNTFINNYNYSAGLSIIGDWGHAGASIREFRSDYGIPGGFIGGHKNGVDIEMWKRSISGQALLKLGLDPFRNVEATFNRTYYNHTEFENANSIGAEFVIKDYSGKLSARHGQYGIFSEGTIGIEGGWRDLQMGGFVFTPPTTATSLSAYVFENILTESVNIQLAARYDYKKFEPRTGNPSSKIGFIRNRTFNTWSLSAAALKGLSETVSLGLALSKSSRTPTTEELFSEGPHLAAYSYEVGNPDLEAESGFGFEAFLRYNTPDVTASLTGFWNELNAYIIPRNTGEFNYQQLLPIYRSEGVEARLTGVEAEADIAVTTHLSVSATLSYTYGELTEEGAALPLIPPLKSLIDLTWTRQRYNTGLSLELAASQTRTDRFEEATAGYAVLNFYFQYVITYGRMVHNISVNADNLFDREYRNHLSRIKSIMPEAGRNFRFTYRIYF